MAFRRFNLVARFVDAYHAVEVPPHMLRNHPEGVLPFRLVCTLIRVFHGPRHA